LRSIAKWWWVVWNICARDDVHNELCLVWQVVELHPASSVGETVTLVDLVGWEVRVIGRDTLVDLLWGWVCVIGVIDTVGFLNDTEDTALDVVLEVQSHIAVGLRDQSSSSCLEWHCLVDWLICYCVGWIVCRQLGIQRSLECSGGGQLINVECWGWGVILGIWSQDNNIIGNTSCSCAGGV